MSAFGIEVPEGENLAKYVKSEHNNLRSSSKIVLFGLIYGRSAFSLSKQLRIAGIEEADKAYAERVIEGIFNKYPRLQEYMDRQRAAVYNPGYAENPFGMRRYFFPSSSRSVMAGQERCSINFPKPLELGNKNRVNSWKAFVVLLLYLDLVRRVW